MLLGDEKVKSEIPVKSSLRRTRRISPREERMDKRRANRYSFRMKAQVDSMGTGELPDPIETWTRDVSSKGLFLELDQPLDEGTRMNLTLQLPSEVTGKPVLLRCLSRVVRVIHEGEHRVGVGAVIENYEFDRTAEEGSPT